MEGTDSGEFLELGSREGKEFVVKVRGVGMGE